MPQFSREEALRDGSAYRRFTDTMNIYKMVHRIHFLKDLLFMAAGGLAVVDTHPTAPCGVYLAAVAIPVAGFFAHAYHWGDAEAKEEIAKTVKEDVEAYRRTQEQLFRQKMGNNQEYRPQLPKSTDNREKLN